MDWAFLSADWSYYNGLTPATAGLHGAIVCTARGNQGAFSVTTYGAQQVSYAQRSSLFIGDYFFNGNLDAYTCGVLFAQSALFGFTVGQSLILIDCEDEGDTGTHAWGPDQAIAFANGVRSVRPDIPYTAFICYMNYTVNRRFNWSGCVALAMGLMYARPGGPMDYLYWPADMAAVMKQDGTVNGADADYHNLPFPLIVGGGAITPARRKTMTTLYGKQNTDPKLFALAGDSPGTPANWLETQDYDGVAVPWAQVHGNALYLSEGSWNQFKEWYLSPLSTGATATVNIDSAAMSAAVQAGVQAAIGGLDFALAGTIKKES